MIYHGSEKKVKVILELHIYENRKDVILYMTYNFSDNTVAAS